MAIDYCSAAVSPCPSHDQSVPSTANGSNSVAHVKNRNFNMTVGSVIIPLQSRTRNFSIGYTQNVSYNPTKIVYDNDGLAVTCENTTGTFSGTISENAIFSDTEFIYLDHINGIAMWREFTSTCVFQQTSSKLALFRTAYGSFYTVWFQISPVIIQQAEVWKLLINGKVEIVDNWVGYLPVSVPDILWPLPLSMYMPFPDPTRCPQEFYDYFSDTSLEQSDGGIDFYYPSWLRAIGLDKTIDQADAADRYQNYFLNNSTSNGLPPSESFPLPGLPSNGYAIPQGNAVVDSKGNALVSFKTRNLTVNRIYKVDKTMLNLNTLKTPILTGNKLTLYPVSVI